MTVPTNDKSLSDNTLALAKAMHSHLTDANGHNLATTSKAGFMSPLDKSKLDALDTSVTALTSRVSALESITKIDLGGVG